MKKKPFKSLSMAMVLMLCALQFAQAETIQNLKKQNFNVRVEIIRSYWNIKAVFSGPFVIHDSRGEAFSTFSTGRMLKISAVDSEPLKNIYRVILATYSYEQRARAEQLAAEASRKLGTPVSVVRPLKPKNLVVASGSFSTYDNAKEFLNRALQHYPDASVRKHLEKPVGKIRIMDGEGNVLGNFEDHVSFEPLSRNARTVFSGIKYSWDDWRESHSTERYYRGDFEIRFNKYGKLICINTLHVEDYLYGIVPLEIGDFAPFEALKAQAVAARSEALRKVNSAHHINDPFDFCNEMHCQVYHGAKFESERCNRAVDETRGLVMLYNGEIIDAVYSHSCGGMTANDYDVWPGSRKPYLRARLDTEGRPQTSNLSDAVAVAGFLNVAPKLLCNPAQDDFPSYADKYFRWTRTFTVDELSARVNKYYPIGTITNISITGRGKSGRVSGVLLRATKGTWLLDTEQRIRVTLGGLYSTLFYIDKEFDVRGALKRMTFHGGGFGHGVGLCQMGAYMMAEHGYTYREILRHYFTDVEIRYIY